MANSAFHPYSHNPADGPFVIFPNHADQILSNCIHILGVSLISFCLARRTEHEQLLTRQGWLNLTWTRFCCIVLFFDSWFFLAFSGVLINGVGLSYSLPVCSLGIYSCIIFYALSKFIIYGFLTERVWIVWSAGKITRRIHSQTYKVCASIIIAYSFIFALLIIGRLYTLRSSDGSCEIGLKFFASIPLVSFDLLVNIFLTALFIWPLYRDNINNPRLRNVALRTLIAAGVALTTSSVNIAILAGLGGKQLGWVCLGSCSADVTVNALVIYWVTAPAYRDHDVSNHNLNANNANQNGNYDNDYHGQSIPSLRVPLSLLSIGAVLTEGPGMSPSLGSPVTPVTPVERDDGQGGDRNKIGRWFGWRVGRIGRREDEDMLPSPIVAVYLKRKKRKESGWKRWRDWMMGKRAMTTKEEGGVVLPPSPVTASATADVSSGQGRGEDRESPAVYSERHRPGLIVKTDDLNKDSDAPGIETSRKAGFVLLADSSTASKDGSSSDSTLPMRQVITRSLSSSGLMLSRSRLHVDEDEDRGEGSSTGLSAKGRDSDGDQKESGSLKRKRNERRQVSKRDTLAIPPENARRSLVLQIPEGRRPVPARSQSWDDELVSGWNRRRGHGVVGKVGKTGNALAVMVEHEVMRLEVSESSWRPARARFSGGLRDGGGFGKERSMLPARREGKDEDEFPLTISRPTPARSYSYSYSYSTSQAPPTRNRPPSERPESRTGPIATPIHIPTRNEDLRSITQ